MTSAFSDSFKEKIQVSKLDVARRQLRTAISLWFSDADPISIHTLAAAAHEILHRLFKREGRADLMFDSDLIKEEYRADWWKILKKDANFFKHADRDPDKIHTFHLFANEMFILFSIKALYAMGQKAEFEDTTFLNWLLINRPEIVKPGAYDNFNIEDIEHARTQGKAPFYAMSMISWRSRKRA